MTHYRAVFKLTPTLSGWAESVLYRFQGGKADGQYPFGGLTLWNGSLYGTTSQGGPLQDAGIAFNLATDGSYYRVIFNFGHSGDGRHPLGGLLADSAGNLYDTTAAGGTSSTCVIDGNTGCGTVVKLIPRGRGQFYKAYFYSFLGGKVDGADPWGGLIENSAGVLFGTTAQGGRGVCGKVTDVGCGIVFALTPTQSGYQETFQASLLGGSYGEHPVSSLVADASGILYGTASHGGTSSACTNGCGLVFKVAP